jgi:hypothetical protein
MILGIVAIVAKVPFRTDRTGEGSGGTGVRPRHQSRRYGGCGSPSDGSVVATVAQTRVNRQWGAGSPGIGDAIGNRGAPGAGAENPTALASPEAVPDVAIIAGHVGVLVGRTEHWRCATNGMPLQCRHGSSSGAGRSAVAHCHQPWCTTSRHRRAGRPGLDPSR